MNVYQFLPDCEYSGGVILVAARTPEEATKTLIASTEDHRHCYAPELVPGLTFKTRKPALILSRLYIE